jgi:hypothetical protein
VLAAAGGRFENMQLDWPTADGVRTVVCSAP